MNENNELNDIILNKSSSANSNKKIILAVATLGVILIIVVMLMNSLSSTGTDNLPKAVLPPQPQTQTTNDTTQEPLFEEIEVTEEPESTNANLEEIAQKLKEESVVEEEEAIVPPVVETPKVVEAPVQKAAPKPSVAPKSTSQITYYIQVGSFSKYEPNKKFLNSISSLGFNYKYHKVGALNKVLVGPFATEKAAKDARRVLRAKVEPGAFLVRL
ncbi:MAG: SPOR domain-containing protein [Campylobacterales bacterium]|nr:SPOR domain-containing protein [Campylobacterales bacterium]